jgi:hypothetical protein
VRLYLLFLRGAGTANSDFGIFAVATAAAEIDLSSFSFGKLCVAIAHAAFAKTISRVAVDELSSFVSHDEDDNDEDEDDDEDADICVL